jgi:hypothetical protein
LTVFLKYVSASGNPLFPILAIAVLIMFQVLQSSTDLMLSVW